MAPLPRFDTRATRLPAPGSIDLGRGISPRAAGEPFAALAELGGQAARLAGQALEVRVKARAAAEHNDARLTAIRALDDLQLGIERDPDFDGAEQRFQEGLAAIGESAGERITSESRREVFQTEFESLAEAKRVEISRGSFAKRVDAAKATLDAGLPELARLAAGAGNRVERELLLDQGRAMIESLVETGLISRQAAVAKGLDFLSKVDDADARRLITEDPDGAVEALLEEDRFTNLDPVLRARLIDTATNRAEAAEAERVRLADKTERDAEKAARAAAEAKLKDAFARHADGELTRADVDEIQAEVTPAEFKSLLALVDPAADEVRDDPDSFAQLQSLIHDNPDEAADLALRLHQARLITNETFKTALDRARVIGRQEGPRSEYERSRRFLAESLDPGPLVQDPVGRARVAEALLAFDDFAGDGDRGDAELRKRAFELRDQFTFVNLRDELISLPRPRFGQVPRSPGDPAGMAAALDAAEAATVERFEAGEISQGELDTEAGNFARWRRYIERQAAAGEGAK